MKDGKDKRFDKVRDQPLRFLVFWLIQGLWVFVTLLPTLMLNESKRDRPLGAQDYIGWAIWAAGMVFEVTADLQKSAFRRDPANDVRLKFQLRKGYQFFTVFSMFQGKFINTGLWSISRHPNYFGEISLWFGLYVSASSVFSGLEYLAVLSPVFVHLLITKVSGIPLLEKAALKKWGSLPQYKEYLKNTPVLVPFLNR